MALSIISNQAASIATRSLGQANDAATATAEKLSSGKRINSAKDDAAGSAIAARLSAEVAGLQQAGVNAGQASSLLQIADGAFQNVEDILTRAKSLSVQAGSDQISDSERAFLDQEFQSLKNEIDRISEDTEFNGTQLVSGAGGNAKFGDAAVKVTVDDGNGGTNFISASSVGGANFEGTNVNGIGVMGIDLGRLELNNDIDMATDGGVAQTLTTNVQVANLSFTDASNMFTLAGVMVFDADGVARTETFQGTLNPAAVTGSTVTRDTAVTLNITGASPPAGLTGATVMVSLSANVFTTAPGVDINSMNGVLFSGVDNTNFTFKVGTGTDATADEISVDIGAISTSALGIGGENVLTKANADVASDKVSQAIDRLQAKRSDVGAAQNRLDFAAQNVELTRENQEAARSELEDLNVAKAITEFSQQQLLVQAGTSTLSQANQLPQNLLQLFR